MLVALLSVPLLNLAAAFAARSVLGDASRQKAVSFTETLAYVYRGGPRHHVFQLFATVLWMISLSLCIVSIVSGRDVWAGGVARTICGVLFAIVAFFCIKAHMLHLELLRRVLSFRRCLVGGMAFLSMQLSSVGSALVFDVSHRMRDSRLTITDPLLLPPAISPQGFSSASSAISWTPHHEPVVPHAQSERLVCLVQIMLALACIVVASMSTYGVSGYVLHRYMPRANQPQPGKSRRGEIGSWTFFQPFKGGAVFVVTQVLLWTYFGAVVAGLLHVLTSLVYGLTIGPVSSTLTWLLACGMPSVPVLSALSVLSYVHSCPRASTDDSREASSLPPFHIRALVLAALCLPAHIWVLLVALPYTIAPSQWPRVLALQAVLHVGYFAWTARGDPALTGCRRWPEVIVWLRKHVGPTLTWWMRSCEVKKCFPGALDPSQKYIFAYVPHSMYPAGAAYSPLLPSWAANFPGVTPVTLTASIMHYVPIMRDIGAWVGFRTVSRAAFKRALEVERHVLVCPGGQSELMYTNEGLSNSDPVVRLCVKHKGFCRLAVEHQAAVVPIIAYGEIFQLQNAVGWRWLLERCYRCFGLPIPYLLRGYRGTPLPDRRPCHFAVGAPVWPGSSGGGAEHLRDLTDNLHTRFYESVAALWHATKDDVVGYSKHTLKWDRKLE